MSLDRSAIAAALPAYEIGDELGSGAWGVVLGARHRQLRRDVAIKQLPPAFASDEQVRSRFVAEARLLGSLDHPHIVPVYDFVERDGICLLVMEKLSGGTAWTRFADEGFDAPSACAVALVTAVALQYAHDRGVLHRDIKPENLLFAGDGQLLKVGDFGIAKVLAGGRTLATIAGEVLGTPAYMAPEQATGAAVTPATDIYALGTTLFELLTGRLPFDGAGSALAMLYQRVHERPTHIAEVAPEVHDAIHPVVMTALATDPQQRHASADAFALALAAAATQAFGQGWMDRSGVRGVLGGPVAALVEREAAAPPPLAVSAPVFPRETIRSSDAPRLPAVAAAIGIAADVVAPDAVAADGVAGDGVVLGPDVVDELVPVAEFHLADRQSSLGELRQLLSRSRQPVAAGPTGDRASSRAPGRPHERRESDLLEQLRSGALPWSPADRASAQRLLGAHGSTPAERFGLAPSASVAELRRAGADQLSRWQQRARDPSSGRAVADAAQLLVRSCERTVAELDAPDPR